MGSSCVTVPTLTTTSVQVVQSTQTIINTSTSVAPPQTTVFASRSVTCPSPPPSSSAAATPPAPSCRTETLAITSVIPGSSATFQVTETKVVSVTNSNVNTLFSTSCTAVASSPNSPTPPSSTTSMTSTTPTPSTTSSTSTTSTTSTTSSTSSSSTDVPTTSQGTPKTSATTTSAVVITATSLATTTGSGGSAIVVTLTSTFTSSSLPSAAAVPDGSRTPPPKIGAIVGGSVGGFFGFFALAFIIWLFLRRRPKWDDFDEPVPMPMSTHNWPAPTPEPIRQPYEYGRVGYAPWEVAQTSPPMSTGQSLGSGSSPIVGLQQYQSTQQVGPSQGQTRSRLASTSSGSHYTQPSLTSLNSPTFGAEQVPDGPLPMPDVPRPVIQNNFNMGRIQQGQPGPSSVNQWIGAIENGSAAGPSGAASQGYHPPPQAGTGHTTRPSVSEFDAYQEHQPLLSPWTAQRAGNGQGVHLDGPQAERPISSATGVTAPPAYTA